MIYNILLDRPGQCACQLTTEHQNSELAPAQRTDKQLCEPVMGDLTMQCSSQATHKAVATVNATAVNIPVTTLYTLCTPIRKWQQQSCAGSNPGAMKCVASLELIMVFSCLYLWTLVSLDGNHRGVLPAMCTGAYSQAQVVEVTLAAAAAVAAAVLLSSAALRSALRWLR
jgi:hypothetical protein